MNWDIFRILCFYFKLDANLKSAMGMSVIEIQNLEPVGYVFLKGITVSLKRSTSQDYVMVCLCNSSYENSANEHDTKLTLSGNTCVFTRIFSVNRNFDRQ